MSEVYWSDSDLTLSLRTNRLYAQTFSPFLTHIVDTLRIKLRYVDSHIIVKASIQYLTPAGWPTGADLTSYTFEWWHEPWGRYTNIRQKKIPPFRLVAGVNYALVLQAIYYTPPRYPSFWYEPPPTTYPRGWLIKSEDDGLTWDTTNLGCMLFGEFGDPPVKPVPYEPPITHWAVTQAWKNDFTSTACIRVATTEPATLRAYVTKVPPVPREAPVPRRGGSVICLTNYTFKDWLAYDQKEKDDSLYHTFYLSFLKKNQRYWVTFIATSARLSTVSAGPIFAFIHPDAPPFTTIRRPIAPGHHCHIPYQTGPGCPFHYRNVDDTVPDEDATAIWNGDPWTGYYLMDTYKIDPLSSPGLPIDELHLTTRVRRQGGYAYASGAKILLRIAGYDFYGPTWSGLSDSWQNRHWHVPLNPYTGLPWVSADFDNLEIGIALLYYRGVGWGTQTHCTQLYCRIIHKCSAYQ